MKIKQLNDNKITVEAGISNGLIGKGRKRGAISQENISKILQKYTDLNANWLLTGEGEMLKSEKNQVSVVAVKSNEIILQQKSIPLVMQNAIAGFGNADFSISEADVKEYYIIPKFKYCKVDFMIEISGSSMYPKYNSGDIVACTIIRDSTFIQWNKCHIIATREQGILCKRLRQASKENHLLAVSDNNDYPPFEISTDEITGVALVVGVIRLK
jgi:phage repressor protein C with HTH and peptisase S24 domain